MDAGKNMKKLMLIVGISLMAFPALAQVPTTEATVSLADCKRVVKHKPRADVAYKAGVDVRGKSVVAAQGTGESPGQFKLPEKISIDFGLDLAGKYGVSGTGEQTATTSLFKVEYDLAMGGLTINGKPMSKADSRAIAKACDLILNK